jgi:hypothetical protein
LFIALLAMPFGTVNAAAIDLPTTWSAPVVLPHATAQVRIQAASMPSPVSELPEPEVFAMMLVGVILIGYRARRDSSDTFR